MNKPICLFHSADSDGKCSAAIVKHFCPEAQLYGINYGQVVPWDLLHGRDVIMLDFSLQPWSDMEELRRTVRSLVWIDHHKASIDLAYKNGWSVDTDPAMEYILQTEEAACEATWRYFTGQDPINPVYLLGRYDVWDHKDPMVLPFQYGMKSIAHEPEDHIWKQLFSIEPARQAVKEDIINRGLTILDFITEENKGYTTSLAFETVLEGYPAIACNRGIVNSMFFGSVYDPKQHNLMIAFARLPSKRWTVSLYTETDVDVSAIARKFGGGGHQKAAGFQCKELPFDY
jgi:oligoribonuclease NrnB/cAMP/cGMP phosphodiesterase (DHH superfamily)